MAINLPMTPRTPISHFGKALLPLITAAFLGIARALAAEDTDWPHWRGLHDNGTAGSDNCPIQWDETTNMLWKAPLPGKGSSTPIVWKKQIFLTAPADGEDAVLALDWSGKPLWQTKLGTDGGGKHRNSSASNPSPVKDGRAVFVYFKSGILAALELDGRIRWQTNLVERYGRDTLYFDQGTSPALTEKDVVIARMHHGESWLAAFDKNTGELHWKVARNYNAPVEGDQAYSTPLVITRQNKEVLLVWGAEHLTAHDPKDGSLRWSCGGFNPDAKANWPAVATPVIAGDLAVVCAGRADRGQPHLHGIKLDGFGDVTATNRLWSRDDTGSFVPCPIEYKGRIYLVRDRGEVDCLDPITGKTLWSDAFPRTSLSYFSSPIIVSGKLYAAREDGTVFVANVEPKFELLAENKLDEHFIASLVSVSGRLLIRGDKSLYCIGDK